MNAQTMRELLNARTGLKATGCPPLRIPKIVAHGEYQCLNDAQQANSNYEIYNLRAGVKCCRQRTEGAKGNAKVVKFAAKPEYEPVYLETGKIFNPETKRMVKIDGDVGKLVLSRLALGEYTTRNAATRKALDQLQAKYKHG